MVAALAALLLVCAHSNARAADLDLTPEWMYDAVRWYARELAVSFPEFNQISFRPPQTEQQEDGTFAGTIGVRQNVVLRYKCNAEGRLTEVRVGSSQSGAMEGWQAEVDNTVFSLVAALLTSLFTGNDAEWKAASEMAVAAVADFSKIERETSMRREYTAGKVQFVFSGTNGRAASAYSLTLTPVGGER